MSNDIKTIADHYGYLPQSRQLIEEMAELTVALNKLWRHEQFAEKSIAFSDFCIKQTLNEKKTKCLQNVHSEIADVEIMLEQIKYLLSCHNEVEQVKEQKIARQIQRIKSEVDKHE